MSLASGSALAFDGDLVRHGDGADSKPGSMELAVRSIGKPLDMTDKAIRQALEQDPSTEFERSALYRRVFDLAERRGRRPLPRALAPSITPREPKISRKLTTEGFARRVDARHRRCLARIAAAAVADNGLSSRLASAFK